jgi:hypothetical protein
VASAAKAVPPGAGGRFKALAAQLAAKGATDPDGLAAKIGRKKYGRSAFQMMAAAGKKS